MEIKGQDGSMARVSKKRGMSEMAQIGQQMEGKPRQGKGLEEWLGSGES